MDVKCEKCGTEYEFDDAKVTEAGITVKCTHCGHLFRVVRSTVIVDDASRAPERGPPPDPPPRPHHWMVRNSLGEVREFKDLATLQQWIVERKVAREDEISKTGESWKPLGSIVELSSFFLAVDGADRRERGPAHSLTPSPGPAPPPPRSQADMMATGEFRLEGPRRHTAPLGSAGPDRLERAFDATPAPQSAPPLSRGPGTMPGTMRGDGTSGFPARETLPPETQHVFVHRTPPPPPPPPSRTDLSFTFDAAQPPLRPAPRAASGGRAFLTGVLATVALAGVAYFVHDQLNDEPATPRRARDPAPAAERKVDARRVERTLARGDAALRTGSDEGLALAEAAYAEVLQLLGDPAADSELAALAQVGRARVALTRGEYARVEGRDAAVHLDLSERALAAARLLASDEPAVKLATAEHHRVQGDVESARRQLSLAETAGAQPAEVALVRAALELHGGGDPAVVVRALGELPVDLRRAARPGWQRAVALSRAGETEEAIVLLDEVLEKNPKHDAALRLRERLQTVVEAQRVKAEMEAGASAPLVVAAVEEPAPPAPPPAKPEPPARPARPAPAPQPKADPKPAGQPEPAEASGSYDSLMSRGYQKLEQGQTSQARGLFEAASRLQPTNPEPLANLGWCDLDTGRTAQALEWFRKSLARNPRYADGMFGLGVAFEKRGERAEAIRAYEEYLKAHPRGRKADMVKRKLQHLR